MLGRVLFPTARSRERRRARSGKLQRSRASNQTAASIELHQNAARCELPWKGRVHQNHAQRQRPRSHATHAIEPVRTQNTVALPQSLQRPTTAVVVAAAACWLLAAPRSAWRAGPPTQLIVSIQHWTLWSGGITACLPACLLPSLRWPCCDAADTDRRPLTGFLRALVHWGATATIDAAGFQKAIITAANEVYA